MWFLTRAWQHSHDINTGFCEIHVPKSQTNLITWFTGEFHILHAVSIQYNRCADGGNRLEKWAVKVAILVSQSLLCSCLIPLWVWRVSDKWCALVTDQTSGVSEGNGMDTVTCWKKYWERRKKFEFWCFSDGSVYSVFQFLIRVS